MYMMPESFPITTTKTYDKKFNEYIKHKKIFYREVQKNY